MWLFQHWNLWAPIPPTQASYRLVNFVSSFAVWGGQQRRLSRRRASSNRWGFMYTYTHKLAEWVLSRLGVLLLGEIAAGSRVFHEVFHMTLAHVCVHFPLVGQPNGISNINIIKVVFSWSITPCWADGKTSPAARKVVYRGKFADDLFIGYWFWMVVFILPFASQD